MRIDHRKNKTMIEKLNKLVSKCKGSVTITYNDHTTNYQTIKQHIEEDFCNNYEDLDPSIKDEIIRRNQIVEIQFYPDTPIGSYFIAHYDLEMALNEALSILND